MGNLGKDFLRIRGSEGVPTLAPAVLVEPAGGSVLAIICPHCIHLSSSKSWAPSGARVDFGKEVRALPAAARLSSPVTQAHFISLGPPNCRMGKIVVFAFLRSRAAGRAEGA